VSRWRRLAREAIPVPAAVEFDNDLSASDTVVDVTAQDRPGLLYRITRVFGEEGLDIRTALVATQGVTAADSFYVRDAAGGKFADAAAMKRVRRRLVDALASS
ncbi:MAG: ACT domain-containing protein, partial [Candidatus Krumholzibacteriota bacterium]|nr:ACT domain-containing protein [Candidatus Krumholzibacteriota bacterium]